MPDAYVKQTWIDGTAGGTPISAARLTHIEDGIDNATVEDGVYPETAGAETITGDWSFSRPVALPTFTRAGLPGPTVDTRLARVLDDRRGFWADDGTDWIELFPEPDVRWWGAKPNGSDATAGLEQCSVDVAAAGGGKLRLGAGTYNYTRLLWRPEVIYKGIGQSISVLKCTDSSAGSSVQRADDGGTLFRAGAEDMAFCTSLSGITAAQDANPDLIGLNLCGVAYGKWKNVLVAGFGQGGVVLARAEGGTEGLGFVNTTQDGNYHTFSGHLSIIGCGKFNSDEAALWFKYKANSNEFDHVQSKGSGTVKVAVFAYGSANQIGLLTAESVTGVAQFKDWAFNNNISCMRLENISGTAVIHDIGARGNFVGTSHPSTTASFETKATGAYGRTLAGEINDLRTGPLSTTDLAATSDHHFLDVLGLLVDTDGLLYVKSPGYGAGTVAPKLQLRNTVLATVAGDTLAEIQAYNNDSTASAAGINAVIRAKAFDGIGQTGWSLLTGKGGVLVERLELNEDTTVRNGKLILEATRDAILRISSTANDSAWVGGTSEFGRLEFRSADASGGGAGVRAAVRAIAMSSTGADADVTISTSNTTTNDQERVRITAGGDVALGKTALATAATTGFTRLPSVAGTPTGVPAAITGSATVPTVVDTAASKLWAYIGGAWKSVTFA